MGRHAVGNDPAPDEEGGQADRNVEEEDPPITPDQVGLPIGARRRTPGLRREEVAQLAGVGVTWYTWLEQGRDIKVSEQVLDAICRTLMLDAHERAHVFTLAGAPRVASIKECDAVPAPVPAILDQCSPFPAVVMNGRYDILAYNQAYTGLMGDIGARCPSTSATPCG
jgi:transcriptional regulator with XRE-family HTH domain